MKAPLFSFLIVSWNRGNLLSLCLESLFANAKYIAQSEVLLLDNGSVDNTKNVLEKYAAYPNVTIIYRDKNYGLNSYKKLLRKAKGKYLVTIDEDVIVFPPVFDQHFIDYFEVFPEFGYLSLDVVQNEHTNGAKPDQHFYEEISKAGLAIEKGPAGAWCACFKRKDFRKISWLFYLVHLNMKRPHDAMIIIFFQRLLGLSKGIMKGVKCFHACGPYYAKMYGFTDLQIAKYQSAGLTNLVNIYSGFQPEPE